jgi:diacylglycerol O-acyltransferase
VRTDFDQPAIANKVSALLLDLPVDFAEPGAAHGAVTTRMRTLKSSGEAAGGVLTTALAGWLPAAAMSATVRAVRHLPQHVVTTVTTNVPGPRTQVRMLDREMVALYPYVPIGDRIRIAVALTSYNGRLNFGVTSDRDSVPDIEVLLTGLTTCLAELVTHAAETKPVRS